MEERVPLFSLGSVGGPEDTGGGTGPDGGCLERVVVVVVAVEVVVIIVVMVVAVVVAVLVVVVTGLVVGLEVVVVMGSCR